MSTKIKINYNETFDHLTTEGREPNEYFDIYKISILCVGSSGSGKTTATFQLIKNNIIDYDFIFICIPFETLPGLYENFIKTLTKKVIIINITGKTNKVQEYNKIKYIDGFLMYDDYYNIVNEIQKDYKRRVKPLFIFDDFINSLNKFQLNEYYHIIHNMSRMNANSISLAQQYFNIPVYARSSYTILMIFVNYLPLSSSINLLKNSVVNNLNNEQIKKLIDFIKKQPFKHIPLFVVNHNNPNKSIIYNNYYIYTIKEDDLN